MIRTIALVIAFLASPVAAQELALMHPPGAPTPPQAARTFKLRAGGETIVPKLHWAGARPVKTIKIVPPEEPKWFGPPPGKFTPGGIARPRVIAVTPLTR